MALAVANAGRLTPEIRLAQSISQFEASLNGSQKADFRSLTLRIRNTPPTVNDVMNLTAEVDRRAGKKTKRCFGPRFTSILTTVQQYAALGDIVIGGSQNMVACGVWCVVRMSLLALSGLSTHMEKFSSVFMTIGRSSPRYQSLALLYGNSDRLRKYLAEYFIVVVDVCHQFLDFSQKSVFSQLTASLTDAKLRQAEGVLTEWALQIKEEVDLLNTSTLVDDTREISQIRALVDMGYHNRKHQKNIRRRVRWLDACTRYDHETAWKQARKRGHATVFGSNQSYLDWKSFTEPESLTLVISGKLGSGKTVLAANIVDDLNLTRKETVCYFFCRHDTMYSCQARTIIGSLCRQLLQCHLNDDTMDHLLGEHVPNVNIDDLVVLGKAILASKGRVYFVLDGLDECVDSERRLVTQILHKLQAGTALSLLVSLRSRPDDAQTNYYDIRPQIIFKCLDSNPDIEAFIDSELTARIQAGELVLGDPGLVIEVREALSHGAQGMFLWVALQIESLCSEQTDTSIRQALRDLPRDLPATYKRILEKAQLKTDHTYQRRILGCLLSAFRPLRIGELREALGVVAGDTNWDPDKHVNSIYHTLACCGSLIVVAEEELTVHFIHQSVAQFLHQGAGLSPDLHFDLSLANLEFGDICVTYLSYGIFDQRVSTQVVPNLSAGLAPAKIAQNTLQDAGVLGQLALQLLKFRAARGPDIGRMIAETNSMARKRRSALEPFQFLAYASEHWMLHTTAIHDKHLTFSLWKHLLKESRFDGLVWGPNEMHPDHLVVDEESGNIWKLPPRITWAVSHSHLPLLEVEIRGRHGIRGLASINPYINLTLSIGTRLTLDDKMCLKLFRIALVFKSTSTANALLLSAQDTLGRNAFLEPYFDENDLTHTKWIISLEAFGDLEDLQLPLVELACRNRDADALEIAIRRKADVDWYFERHPMAHILGNMRVDDELDIRMATNLLKARCSLRQCDDLLDQIYEYLDAYLLVNKCNDLEPFSAFMRSDRYISLSLISRIEIVRRACGKGHLKLARALVDGLLQSRSNISSRTVSSWLMSALHSVSKDRILLAEELIELPMDKDAIDVTVLIRCAQLRLWELARAVLQSFKSSWRQMEMLVRALRPFADNVQASQLIHSCAVSGDHVGLTFLLLDFPADLGFQSSLSEPSSSDTEFPGQIPLHLVFTQHISGFEDAIHFVQSAAIIYDQMGRHLGVHGSETCAGETANSCIEYMPQFYSRVIEGLFSSLPDSVLDAPEDKSPTNLQSLGVGFLKDLLPSWRDHLGLITDARMRILLLPVLQTIVSSFGKLSQEFEARFSNECWRVFGRDLNLVLMDHSNRRHRWLGAHSEPLVELTKVILATLCPSIALMQILDEADVDNMFNLLILKYAARDSIEHHVRDFKIFLSVRESCPTEKSAKRASQTYRSSSPSLGRSLVSNMHVC